MGVHTAGPWHWEYHPERPYRDKVIALVAKRDVLVCTGSTDAAFGLVRPEDACLIAAAPDLLAVALEVIRLDEEDAGLLANDGLDVVNLTNLARAAIAKAEGKEE